MDSHWPLPKSGKTAQARSSEEALWKYANARGLQSKFAAQLERANEINFLTNQPNRCTRRGIRLQHAIVPHVPAADPARGAGGSSGGSSSAPARGDVDGHRQPKRPKQGQQHRRQRVKAAPKAAPVGADVHSWAKAASDPAAAPPCAFAPVAAVPRLEAPVSPWPEDTDGAEVHALLRPEQLTQSEADMLTDVGSMDEHESPIRSFHAAVVDCLEGCPERQANNQTHELLFFGRRRGHECTGLAMLCRRKHTGVGERTKRRGITYELRRLASAEGKGGGARLHRALCDALLRHAASLGWQDAQEPLTMVLTLQSCTVRAGGFYLKMGWTYDGGRRVSRAPSRNDIGALMRLDLTDKAAWNGYWSQEGGEQGGGNESDGHSKLLPDGGESAAGEGGTGDRSAGSSSASDASGGSGGSGEARRHSRASPLLRSTPTAPLAPLQETVNEPAPGGGDKASAHAVSQAEAEDTSDDGSVVDDYSDEDVSAKIFEVITTQRR